MHYESTYVKLDKNIVDTFFKKRTPGNSIYTIFLGDLDLNKKFKKCTITFHFTDHDTVVGEIKKFLDYKQGRNVISYMKTMVKYLVEERNMKDNGHFCVVVEE